MRNFFRRKISLSGAIRAIQEGDVAKIERFLSDGGDVNSVIDSEGDFSPTLLFLALRNRQEGICRLLLEAGASVRQVNKFRQTPLNNLCFGSKVKKEDDRELEVRLVEMLLDAGSDIEARDDKGGTPLLTAAASGKDAVCQVLLNWGADLNHRRKDGKCAAHVALSSSRPEAVLTVLCEAGINLSLADEDGLTAESLARKQRKTSLVTLLVTAKEVQEEKKKQREQEREKKRIIIEGERPDEGCDRLWELFAMASESDEEVVDLKTEAKALMFDPGCFLCTTSAGLMNNPLINPDEFSFDSSDKADDPTAIPNLTLGKFIALHAEITSLRCVEIAEEFIHRGMLEEAQILIARAKKLSPFAKERHVDDSLVKVESSLRGDLGSDSDEARKLRSIRNATRMAEILSNKSADLLDVITLEPLVDPVVNSAGFTYSYSKEIAALKEDPFTRATITAKLIRNVNHTVAQQRFVESIQAFASRCQKVVGEESTEEAVKLRELVDGLLKRFGLKEPVATANAEAIQVAPAARELDGGISS
jgi:hypothetical protein